MIPPRAILAAVDFSESSRVALSFAARLAKQCHAALHVLHAENPLLVAAAKSTGIDLNRETREELARFASTTVPAGDWTPGHHHIVTGDATSVICHIASREQVDLIVVGMHGMSGATRAMFGSTTEGVLRQAAISVLVVPDSWTPPRPDTDDLSGMGPVVAAIECTCTAVAGAAAACRLAEALGTSVSAIHVVPELPVIERWRGHAEAAVTEREAQERRELETALAAVKTTLHVTLRVETGQVAERLAAAAAEVPGQHPILVLGRHAQGSRRGAPGATAYRVLTLARVPVLVHCLPETLA
ncbi:MAG TPA: universal stress protein [Vicinamibacterales bacterium]|nr:universal stress protein [Vicinamibacterales bacterium]